jgi:hypothetical protein
VSLVIGELNLEGARRQDFDDSSHLPPEQAAIRKVRGEGDDVEQLNGRFWMLHECFYKRYS